MACLGGEAAFLSRLCRPEAKGLVPVEQPAHDVTVRLDLLPCKMVDKGLVYGSPECGQEDVELIRIHILPAEPPPFRLLQEGAGGFCEEGHPVVAKREYLVPSEQARSR